MADFDQALNEVQPAFGASISVLERCRLNGWVSTGEAFEHLVRTCKMLVEQVRTSENTPLLTMLLEGPSGSGKTALAATLALEAGFPFVKLARALSPPAGCAPRRATLLSLRQPASRRPARPRLAPGPGPRPCALLTPPLPSTPRRR